MHLPLANLLALAISLAGAALPLGASEPAVRWSGTGYTTAAGAPVTLRGVNLGCWLLLEPWMMRIEGARDQESLVRAWTACAGPAWTADFRARLRQAWIRAEDLAVVKRCGFTTVRIPFDSRPLMAEEGPIVVREEGFAGLDEAMALAEQAGLYIIIDLHGAPGGQNDDQPTGERGRNNLWTSADAQARTAAVWAAVARRYRDRPLLVAYDLINEPYGSSWGGEATAIAIMDRLVKTVRAEDPDRLIYVPGTSAGTRFYGRPEDRGWTHTGLTEHYYPGLYGAPETVAVHQDFLARHVPRVAEDKRGIPFLVGEFNPVVASAGAPASTRAHFDTYARHGWAATLWALRWNSVSGGNGNSDWCIIANRDPLPAINATTATREDWEAWLRIVAGPRSVNEAMVSAFAATQAPVFPLLPDAPVPTPATGALPAGWTTTTMGAAHRTAAGATTEGAWRLISAGHDLHAGDDAILFVHRPTPGPAWTATTRVTALDASGRYAKGGLMVRQGLAAHAPCAVLHAFPDGRACLAVRRTPGAKAEEQILAGTRLPVDLRLRLAAGQLTAEARTGDGSWQTVGTAPWSAADSHVGLVHCANNGVVPGVLEATPVDLASP